MTSDIVWEFKFPQRLGELTEAPTRDENRYHVATKLRSYDSDHDRSDQDTLVRIREKMKSINHIYSLPGGYFDMLYQITHYEEDLPIHVSNHLCDTLNTITQTLLNALESNPTEDWAIFQARQYRTIIGMMMYLLSRQLRNLVSKMEENGIKMDKDKKSKTIQKATHGSNLGRGGVDPTKWGKDLLLKLQRQLDVVLTCLYYLFSSTTIHAQYEYGILDQDFVVAVIPQLTKLLTSTYTKIYFTHQTLPRSFNNLFICLVQHYCTPDMVSLGGIGEKMKNEIMQGFFDLIKNDNYDHKILINMIILSFSKFNCTLLFSFLFEAILMLPATDKMTLSELPKALKLLGLQLPARALLHFQPMLQTLDQSQSYSIRNSIIELIASIINNAFILAPNYHPSTTKEDNEIFYKPIEFNIIKNKPGANTTTTTTTTTNKKIKSEMGDNDDDINDDINDNDNDDDDDEIITKKNKFNDSDDEHDPYGDDDDIDDDDDDDDNDGMPSKRKKSKKQSTTTTTTTTTKSTTKRKQRYSIGFEDDDAHVEIDDNTSNKNEIDYTTLQTVNQLGPAAAIRSGLIEVILQRLDDVHSESRTRAIQCIGSVLFSTVISFDTQIKCLSLVYNCTMDKSSKVRKNALMLFRAIIQRTIVPSYQYSVTHSLHTTNVKAIMDSKQVELTQIKEQLGPLRQQQQQLITFCQDLMSKAGVQDEDVLMQNKNFAQARNNLDQIDAQIKELTTIGIQTRQYAKICMFELYIIQQILTLLSERCSKFLKSPTLTDVEEAIALILYAFAAHLEEIPPYITALLHECGGNSNIVNYSAQIWGEILLRHHEEALSNGEESPIFLELIRTIIRIPDNAKMGLYKIFNVLTAKNITGVITGTSSHNVMQQFLKDVQTDMNGLIITTQERSLTQSQLNDLYERYNNMFSYLLQSSIEFVLQSYIKAEMLLVDLASLFSLIRALIGTSIPIAGKLYHVFWSLLTSQHAHPYVTTQILDLFLHSIVVISEDEMKELTTFCVNNVIYGLQSISTPIPNSILQYDTTVYVQRPKGIQKQITNKKTKNNKKQSSLKKRKNRSNDDDSDSDIDFQNDSDDDDDDMNVKKEEINPDQVYDLNGEMELVPEIVQQTVLVTTEMVDDIMKRQAQQTLYWTALAEVSIQVVTKLTKNPLPIYEFMLQQMSTVLYQLPDAVHYNTLVANGAAHIPNLCRSLSLISCSNNQIATTDTNGNILNVDVSLQVPQQCHCQSTVLLKATESKTLKLPDGCCVFDKASKLAICVISHQERLTRLFTLTSFITMNILLNIEENEAKIRALCKKEFDQGFHKINMQGQMVDDNDNMNDDDNNNNTQMYGNDDDDDDDDIVVKKGPTKRKQMTTAATPQKRGKNKKSRYSQDNNDDSDNDDNTQNQNDQVVLDDDYDDNDSDFETKSKKKTLTKQPLKKSTSTTTTTTTTKKSTNARGGKNKINNDDATAGEDEEEKAGMISRAEQHIEENIRFIERTLRDPNHFLGMIYRLINHVCVTRRQFHTSVFFSALTARCRLMLLSKDVCKDAIPGLLALLRDIAMNARSLDQEYIINVKQIIALGISDGAQRFPNECATALDQLNQLAVDNNEQVSFYALHALASVLLTGMHKPNRALPHICTCLASDHPRIVTTARALVQTLGSKRDGNVSLIATALPDIISRFTETVRSGKKDEINKRHKVLKELLQYVKTEQEIAKVVKGVTIRLSEQLKLNNLESTGRSGGDTIKFDHNGQPIIETSTKLLLNRCTRLQVYDRQRYATGIYHVKGWKEDKRTKKLKFVEQQVPIIAHQDLKTDNIISTTLKPVLRSCDCPSFNACACRAIFQIQFDFVSGDIQNHHQLLALEAIDDSYKTIEYSSDPKKMIEIAEEKANSGNNTNKKPTAQDFFERSKFLITMLRNIKFNVSSARRFFNDFNDYSQACQHPLLFNELKSLSKHIRGCVTKRGVGAAAANKDDSTAAGKSAIEVDLIDWEAKVDKEYSRIHKDQQIDDGMNDGDDDDSNDSNDETTTTTTTTTSRSNRSKSTQMGDDDNNDESQQPARTTRGGRKAPVKKAPVRKAPAKKAPARKARRGRRKQDEEEEIESEDEPTSSSSGSGSSSSSDDDNDDDDEEDLQPKRGAQKRPAARRGRRGGDSDDE